MLNRTESSLKRSSSLLMQCSQNKYSSLHWEANLSLNWTGVIFVSTVSVHSDLFSINMDPEKAYSLEINPLPWNRSQILSTREISAGLTYNYRNYFGITSQVFHKLSSFMFLFCFIHFQWLLHVKTHSPVLHLCFTFLITMIVWRIIFFSSSAWINTALLAKAIA